MAAGCLQVVLAKALSAGSPLDGTVSQDLELGEGGVLETNDSAEVSYTGWLVTGGAYGQVGYVHVYRDPWVRNPTLYPLGHLPPYLDYLDYF